MKTIEEYLDYERNILQKNELYEKYFVEWSLFWFEKIIKPFLDYKMYEEQYSDEKYNLSFKVYGELTNNFFRNPPINDNFVEMSSNAFDKSFKKYIVYDTPLYHKKNDSEERLKKLFPNAVFEETPLDNLSMKDMFSREKIRKKIYSLEQYCKFLTKSPNFTKEIANIYKEYPFDLTNISDSKRNSDPLEYKNSLDLSLNPELTIKIIKSFPEHSWNLKKIMFNHFVKWRVNWIKERNQRFLSNLLIP